MISAILLAAGESRRMGTFKQLLDYRGKTFVECCVDALLASRVDEVVIVTGHRDAEIRRVLADRRVTIAFNAAYQLGMSSSIQCGVLSLAEQSRAMLIALADQPHITPAIINQLIAVYEAAKPVLVVPTYGGRNGHPILLSAGLKDESLAISADQGLRQVVHAHRQEAVYTEVEDEAVLMDFDYPEDYQRLRQKD